MPTVKVNAALQPAVVSYSLLKALTHSQRQHATTAADKFTCKCDLCFSLDPSQPDQASYLNALTGPRGYRCSIALTSFQN